MTHHTSSPQPHAVERKNKHPVDEDNSHLDGRERDKNTTSTKLKNKRIGSKKSV